MVCVVRGSARRQEHGVKRDADECDANGYMCHYRDGSSVSGSERSVPDWDDRQRPKALGSSKAYLGGLWAGITGGFEGAVICMPICYWAIMWLR